MMPGGPSKAAIIDGVSIVPDGNSGTFALFAHITLRV